MGKESLLGIFLFFPLGNSAQIYYSYDFRGNLTFYARVILGTSTMQVSDSDALGTSTMQVSDSDAYVVDSTFIQISWVTCKSSLRSKFG